MRSVGVAGGSPGGGSVKTGEPIANLPPAVGRAVVPGRKRDRDVEPQPVVDRASRVTSRDAARSSRRRSATACTVAARRRQFADDRAGARVGHVRARQAGVVRTDDVQDVGALGAVARVEQRNGQLLAAVGYRDLGQVERRLGTRRRTARAVCATWVREHRHRRQRVDASLTDARGDAGFDRELVRALTGIGLRPECCCS